MDSKVEAPCFVCGTPTTKRLIGFKNDMKYPLCYLHEDAAKEACGLEWSDYYGHKCLYDVSKLDELYNKHRNLKNVTNGRAPSEVRSAARLESWSGISPSRTVSNHSTHVQPNNDLAYLHAMHTANNQANHDSSHSSHSHSSHHDSGYSSSQPSSDSSSSYSSCDTSSSSSFDSGSSCSFDGGGGFGD